MSNSSNNVETPKILHQTWKTQNLLPKFEEWQSMWKKNCPDYKYKFYTDDDLSEVIEKHFPQYLKSFNSFDKHIERVDFWRYAILYVYGGVYSDLDVFPLKSIDSWLEENKIILGREPIEHAKTYNGTDFLICNAFMISPKGDEFWLELMDFIIEKYSSNLSPVSTTGPGIITKFYNLYPEKFKNVIVTEPNCFYPITFNKSIKTEMFEGKLYKNVSKTCNMKDAYVVHMWEGSWTKEMETWGIILIGFAMIAFILLVIIFSFAIGKGYTK